ncbi:hypothetical protein JCM19274_1254 [Algibacter lectus]|uniref:Uncharacterized protein n=1 Tax=Algibacter lectus TaxID=221126 RepID=A0A090WWK2_9FLAO|nr:hypothetical protein JCM19274_1254 [Algibacter lectus]
MLVALYFSFILSGFAQMNILFIESDDQSNQTVGAYGNRSMITPNIDKLAMKGGFHLHLLIIWDVGRQPFAYLVEPCLFTGNTYGNRKKSISKMLQNHYPKNYTIMVTTPI